MILLFLTIVVGFNSFGQTLSTGATATVCAGGSVVITALPGASGVNNYSWAGGTTPEIVAAAPSPTATISVVPVSSPYSMTCYFFNGTTYITSQTVVITVNPVPAVTGIESLSQCANGDFTLISSNTPQDMSFQWQISSDNGLSWNNQSGATSNNLVLTDLTAQNGKQYRSIASYVTGCSDTTGVKTLTVNALPLNQVPNVNVLIVNDTAFVCGVSSPIVIGLNATQSNYVYQLYDVNTNFIVESITSPAAPVDGAITFSQQTIDRKFGIKAWTPTMSCSLIIHK